MKKDRCALAYANAPLDTQWGKRILSTLLAVVLCLGLLPGAAFAAGTGTYTHADVNTVLDRVVKNETTVETGDTTYDVDKDGKLTSWDAKKMLDSMPESIKVNAMQLTTKDRTSADWVSLEIKDGTLTTTTINKINEFSETIIDLFHSTSVYPEAAALNREKLVVSMSHYDVDKVHTNDSLIQVDPDSFVARELTLQTDGWTLNNPAWYDATTLSDGRLLSVYSTPMEDGNSITLLDGEKLIASARLEIPLVGIAAAEEDNGKETIYGIDTNGNGSNLYSLTLNEVDGELVVEYKMLGKTGIPYYFVDDNSKSLFKASLLYDTASGYLLVAATYYSSGGEAGALYLIDPTDPAGPAGCVRVALPENVVLNSLYQDNRPESEKRTEGVQLYLSENAISLKAGENADLPTVDAYSYRTDPDTGLVTNSKLGANAVEWTSSDSSVVTIEGDSIKAGEVTKQTTVKLTAKATDTAGRTATETVTVTVNPNTGIKVGALIAPASGKANYVWATIDLEDTVKADGMCTFQTVTSGVELKNEYTDLNSGQPVKIYQPGGGYAQELLWGNYYIHNSATPNSYYYTIAPTTPEKESSSAAAHDYYSRIADLTDSPEISAGISHNGTTTAAKDLARVVFVNQGGNIAWLTGTGARDSLTSKSLEFPYSAIAYVGDLTAAQVLANKGVSSLQCDSGSTCHVYYALTTDGMLRQVILVPRAGDLGYTGHRYSLCGTDLGKVTFDDESTTTSMDFLWKDADNYGLLVVRADKSIRYIELKGPTSGTALTASLVGNLTKVTLKDGTTTDVNGVSALYHTGDMTLDEADILRIAGWSDVQASQSAPVAASAISVLSDDGASTPAEEPTTPNTITVPITADKDATNGKWTVKYDTKLTFASATPNDGIVYYKTYDNGNGTVTLAFASRSAIEKDNVLFTLTFTGDGSAEDVKITCDELNEPARTPSSGGGGGGGSTGTDSAVALPSGVTGGSVSSSTDKAKPGDTVTITVEPDEGYVPGTVKVVDKDGKEIAVKDLGNGTYSFIMPTGKVDVQVTFAPATGGFTDVPTDAYYREAVLWAVEKGVTNGVSDTLFGPDQACTRAQIVTFLWRAAGSPEPTAVGSFTDVPADAYYAKAVAWAVENGITTGVAEGLFAPDATCTRAQSVTFLSRALDGTAGTGRSFTDVPADAWYAAAVAWAVEKGITKGTSDTTFSPNGTCTRGQIVTFLYRAMK